MYVGAVPRTARNFRRVQGNAPKIGLILAAALSFESEGYYSTATLNVFLLFTNYAKRVIYLAKISNPFNKSHIKLMQDKGIQCR